MLPMVFIIIIAIGLLLGFVPPEQISRFVGDQSGAGGVVLVGIVGAIMHIPALLSFPLAASILESGASVTAVAAFITTLTSKKMALLRNGMSFVIAILIAFIMGMIL